MSFCPNPECPHRKSLGEPAEFINGVTICSDCGSALSATAPISSGEEKPEYIEYEEVLSTNNPGDAAFVKSFLDAEGIEYLFEGEHAAPFILYAIPLRLMVRKDQVERALEILKDVDLSLTFGGLNYVEEDEE